MVRLLKKDRIKFYSVFILVAIFGAIVMLGKKTDGIDMISSLTSANYIAMILNNIYIFYIFTRCKKIKSIYDKIICRIGSKKFFYLYVINIIVDILLYFFIVDISLYLKLGINYDYLHFFIIFQVLRFSCFLIGELVSMLIFLSKNGNLFILVPIVLNVVFHYFVSPVLVGYFFGVV